MAKVIKVYKERLPRLRLIGRRYLDRDRGPDGGYGDVWDRWFENNDFAVLEQLNVAQHASRTQWSGTEDAQSYVSYMRFVDDTFEYWIGMLFPEGTAVPDGYMSVDVRAAVFGVCWIHGRDDTGELYGPEAFEMCLGKVRKLGWEMADAGWCVERYHPVRFRKPDEAGRVILDFGIELKD